MAVERASQRFGVNWSISRTVNPDGSWYVSDADRHAILLQEIREELKALNALLRCHNFTSIPTTLRTIARHTKRPVRKPSRRIVGTGAGK